MITMENTKTLYDLLINAGQEYAAKTFLKYEREEVFYDKTYSQMMKDSLSFGAWLQSMEQEKPVHVALLGRCSYRYLVGFFGAVSAGGVAVPLDIQAEKEMLIDNISRADIDVLMYDWEFYSEVSEIREACPNIKEFVCMQKVEKKNVPDICKEYKNSQFVPKAKAEECAVLIFTSGTTGRGKGVMLSHANLIDNLFCLSEATDQDQICMNVLPIHHIFCLSGDVLTVMRYGSMLCLCPDISQILKYMDIYKPTSMRVVPMISKMLYNRLVMTGKQHPELSEIEVKNMVLGEKFQKMVSGGGYLAKDLAVKFLNLGIMVGQGYGMSECSPKISVPDYDRPEKLDSVGRLVDRCQVRTVDGEIQVKSPSVMMGYYKDPERTKEAITSDGWLCTGDMGYVDEEGFLYLSGRKKNLIVLSNGENIAPEGIENRFDDEVLVQDILVYGEEDSIAAEVYPNFEYAQVQKIADVEQAVGDIIHRVNEALPRYSKIQRFHVRKQPFEKTSSKKIKRESFFKSKQETKFKEKQIRLPETELQQKIHDLVAGLSGNDQFGIEEDFYTIGLDSLGSILFIEEIVEAFHENITLTELLEHSSVLAMEQLLTEKKAVKKAEVCVQEVYPLTNMQKYFAYIIKGNTTSNLPFFYKVHESIDLSKLAKAISETMDAHPILKANIHFDGKMYMLYRNDSRKMEIPILHMKEQDWKEKEKTLVVPFAYTAEDDLVHACLCETENSKYMFFDVAHIIGDGVTMNILIEDINRRYCGETVAPENFTFYEYILEDQQRESNGLRQRDMEATAALMKDIRLNRSILTKRLAEDNFEKKYGVLRSRFDKLVKKKVLYFGKKYGVSENVLFLTAFNYCIYLFSDEEDIFSNSIHSGRTDSRYARMAGSLFLTYFCRFTREPHEKVIDLLKKTGSQIMNTMKNGISMARQSEMFFQYQGDLLGQNVIGDQPAERQHVQLDSLPFHMQVMADEEGYYQELRFWENRFDEEQLKIFLTCYEHVLLAMLEEPSVRRLKRHLPEEVYPKHFSVMVGELNAEAGTCIVDAVPDKRVKVYVLDEGYYKKPFGAWGKLYIMDAEPQTYTKTLENPYSKGILYETELIARILPDKTLDFLENNGRTVVTDGIHGLRHFPLKAVENVIAGIEGVQAASAYLEYDVTINEMSLTVDVKATDEVTSDAIIQYMSEQYEEVMVPKKINRLD